MFRTNNFPSSGALHKQPTIFYHTEIILKLYEFYRHTLSSYSDIKSIKVLDHDVGFQNITLKFTYLFTPWSRVFLEKLTVL
jgi:hypothetical protein